MTSSPAGVSANNLQSLPKYMTSCYPFVQNDNIPANVSGDLSNHFTPTFDMCSPNASNYNGQGIFLQSQQLPSVSGLGSLMSSTAFPVVYHPSQATAFNPLHVATGPGYHHQAANVLLPPRGATCLTLQPQQPTASASLTPPCPTELTPHHGPVPIPLTISPLGLHHQLQQHPDSPIWSAAFNSSGCSPYPAATPSALLTVGPAAASNFPSSSHRNGRSRGGGGSRGASRPRTAQKQHRQRLANGVADTSSSTQAPGEAAAALVETDRRSGRGRPGGGRTGPAPRRLDRPSAGGTAGQSQETAASTSPPPIGPRQASGRAALLTPASGNPSPVCTGLPPAPSSSLLHAPRAATGRSRTMRVCDASAQTDLDTSLSHLTLTELPSSFYGWPSLMTTARSSAAGTADSIIVDSVSGNRENGGGVCHRQSDSPPTASAAWPRTSKLRTDSRELPGPAAASSSSFVAPAPTCKPSTINDGNLSNKKKKRKSRRKTGEEKCETTASRAVTSTTAEQVSQEPQGKQQTTLKKKKKSKSSGGTSRPTPLLTVDLAAMVSSLQRRQQQQQLQASTAASTARTKTAGDGAVAGPPGALNPLDSSAPRQKRGKQREVPRRKLSALKKVILKERSSRTQPSDDAAAADQGTTAAVAASVQPTGALPAAAAAAAACACEYCGGLGGGGRGGGGGLPTLGACDLDIPPTPISQMSPPPLDGSACSSSLSSSSYSSSSSSTASIGPPTSAAADASSSGPRQTEGEVGVLPDGAIAVVGAGAEDNNANPSVSHTQSETTDVSGAGVHHVLVRGSPSSPTFVAAAPVSTVHSAVDAAATGDGVSALEPLPPEIVGRVHSRRFREYCRQLLTREVDQACTALLETLVRFQDRLHARNPIKAKSRRRLVLGLREVTKHLRLNRVRCVIMSPNLERIHSKGGIDDAVETVLRLCRCPAAAANGRPLSSWNSSATAAPAPVPVVFALSRRALGRALCKLVPVSCVAVLDWQGAEEPYGALLRQAEQARAQYWALVAALDQELTEGGGGGGGAAPLAACTAAAQHASTCGVDCPIGHSRNPSATSAISYASCASQMSAGGAGGGGGADTVAAAGAAAAKHAASQMAAAAAAAGHLCSKTDKSTSTAAAGAEVMVVPTVGAGADTVVDLNEIDAGHEADIEEDEEEEDDDLNGEEDDEIDLIPDENHLTDIHRDSGGTSPPPPLPSPLKHHQQQQTTVTVVAWTEEDRIEAEFLRGGGGGGSRPLFAPHTSTSASGIVDDSGAATAGGEGDAPPLTGEEQEVADAVGSDELAEEADLSLDFDRSAVTVIAAAAAQHRDISDDTTADSTETKASAAAAATAAPTQAASVAAAHNSEPRLPAATADTSSSVDAACVVSTNLNQADEIQAVAAVETAAAPIQTVPPSRLHLPSPAITDSAASTRSSVVSPTSSCSHFSTSQARETKAAAAAAAPKQTVMTASHASRSLPVTAGSEGCSFPFSDSNHLSNETSQTVAVVACQVTSAAASTCTCSTNAASCATCNTTAAAAAAAGLVAGSDLSVAACAAAASPAAISHCDILHPPRQRPLRSNEPVCAARTAAACTTTGTVSAAAGTASCGAAAGAPPPAGTAAAALSAISSSHQLVTEWLLNSTHHHNHQWNHNHQE